MKAVIQRVSNAKVIIDKKINGEIKEGILVFVAIKIDDIFDDVKWLADKIINLRIFEDNQGKMNLSLKDIHGEVLIISQFTLYGDAKKGRRPNFMLSAKPDIAIPLYEKFIDEIKKSNLKIATGKFGADMKVSLTNDGPVTIILESEKKNNGCNR